MRLYPRLLVLVFVCWALIAMEGSAASWFGRRQDVSNPIARSNGPFYSSNVNNGHPINEVNGKPNWRQRIRRFFSRLWQWIRRPFMPRRPTMFDPFAEFRGTSSEQWSDEQFERFTLLLHQYPEGMDAYPVELNPDGTRVFRPRRPKDHFAVKYEQETREEADAKMNAQWELEREGGGGNQAMVQCLSCFQDVPKCTTADCGTEQHQCCYGCTRGWIKAQMENIKKEFPCPAGPACGKTLSEATVRKVLTPAEVHAWLEVNDKNRVLATVPTLAQCHHCQFRVDVDQTKEAMPNFECPECGVSTCRECDRPAHAGKTCADVAQEHSSPETLLDNAVTEALKRQCPRCKHPIIKATGCNHMTCQNCQHHFCYLCNASLDRVFGSNPVYDHYSSNRWTSPCYGKHFEHNQDTTLVQKRLDDMRKQLKRQRKWNRNAENKYRQLRNQVYDISTQDDFNKPRKTYRF